MMKTMLACFVTGLILVGVTGIAQSAGFNAREDCCTEGPPYNREARQSPIVPTKVVYQETLYIEGMGFASRTETVKTIVPKVSDRCDYCSEGFSNEELQYMQLIKVLNRTEPAAGK